MLSHVKMQRGNGRGRAPPDRRADDERVDLFAGELTIPVGVPFCEVRLQDLREGEQRWGRLFDGFRLRRGTIFGSRLLNGLRLVVIRPGSGGAAEPYDETQTECHKSVS